MGVAHKPGGDISLPAPAHSRHSACEEQSAYERLLLLVGGSSVPAPITGCGSGPRIPCRLGCIRARGQRHVNSAPTGGWVVSGGFTSASSFYPHSPHSKAASLSFLQRKVMRPGAGERTDLIPFAQFTGRLQRCVC